MSRQCSVPHHHHQSSFVIRIPLKIFIYSDAKIKKQKKISKKRPFCRNTKIPWVKEKKVFRLQKEIRKIRRLHRENIFLRSSFAGTYHQHFDWILNAKRLLKDFTFALVHLMMFYREGVERDEMMTCGMDSSFQIVFCETMVHPCCYEQWNWNNFKANNHSDEYMHCAPIINI